ncbi:unnamed protein product [Schistocephalus solidus]|uniref:Reverse transcriptase domain-containing protein n=1 Tax=Schistocephalus solidus TaxID=70667 RepID=A0A183SR82_SCHSO|nr:unnamed protein product [Schistocephalus solidus]
MVRQLHNGIAARVTDNGTVSKVFAVTNGVKQGCVLAPTFFSLMFSVMLMDAYRDKRLGIHIAYRTDVHLLISRRMQAQMRVSTTLVRDLLFADDFALSNVTEEDMQRSMDLFAASCADYGFTISTTKTAEHQIEDVQGRRLDENLLRNGDLDRLLEPSQEAELLSSQLPPQNTEAEMARRGIPGVNRNPQNPRHAEASATAMERPPDVATGASTHTLHRCPAAQAYRHHPSTATNTTCPTPTTTVATSDYLPPATSTTSTAPSTSDGLRC